MLKRRYTLWLILQSGLICVGLLLVGLESPNRTVLSVQPVKSSDDLVPMAYLPLVMNGEPAGHGAFPNCRFGATIFPSYWGQLDISSFQIGTYQDFQSRHTPPGEAGLEYWQMIRIHQRKSASGEYLDGYVISPDWEVLETYVRANPGALWIVGNEPDRELIQDDTYPQVYARAYHDIYYFIKSIDSTARIAVAGLVGFTPGREQYLDIVWETYSREFGEPMPADAWTIHPYVLWESGGAGAHVALGTDPSLAIPYSNECNDPASICYAEHDDMNLFAGQIERMRRWMKRHGQQTKPLLVTEWGVLLPYRWEDGSFFYDEKGETFNPERVARFLTNTLNYFQNTTDLDLGYPADDYRLVQQWAWFALSVSTIEASAGNLVEPRPPYTTTYVGRVWQHYVAGITPVIDLRVEAGSTTMLYPGGNVTLTAKIYNTGNISTSTPLTISFYADPNMSTLITTYVIDPLPGCTWGRTVTATWEVGEKGMHPFWVMVSGATDGNPTDNISRGSVLVASEQVFLPMILYNR